MMRACALFYIIGIILLFSPIVGLPHSGSDLEKNLQESGFDDIISIHGPWDFYWNKLIYHDELLNQQDTLGKIEVQLPSYWSDYTINGLTLPGLGFGTFTKTIVLSSDKKGPIGVLIPAIDVAYQFYINGQLMASVGTVGTTEKDEVPGYMNSLVEYWPQTDTLQLLFHVSNFHHRRGGIWKEVKFGELQQVKNYFLRDHALDFISLGVLLAFGLFYLIFSFFKKEEKSLLFLSVSFILVFIRGICTNHFPVNVIFPLSWEWMVKLEYLSTFGALLLGVWGFYFIKPIRWIKWVMQFFTGANILALIVILITKVAVFSYTLYAFYVFLVSFVLLYAIQLVIVMRRNRSVPMLYVLGAIVLVFAAFNDLMIAASDNYIFDFYILPQMFIVFVLLLSVSFFQRYASTLKIEKQLRNELTNLTIELESTVEKRTSQVIEKTQIIEEQNQLLQKDIKLKNRILSIIGHDIRSPLSFVIMGLDVVSDKNIDEGYRNSFVQKILFSVSNLALLVDNLLSWGLSQNKQLTIYPDECDLSTLINRTVMNYAGISENKKITFYQDVPSNVSAWYDENTIHIVLRNLLSNALKFTPQGGEISISLKQESDQVVVSISDSGVGISAGVKELLLSGNDVVSTEGTNREKGTGLGLILCRELITLNNGHFSLESELGTGTKVVFTLPVKSPQ